MKLYSALKKKKKLVGEIAKLKMQIQSKNSYLVGDANAQKYDVATMELTLENKVAELINLKLSINKANLAIQEKIYMLAELKGLLQLWQSVNTSEGIQESLYNDKVITRAVHIDEIACEQRQKAIQDQIDSTQEFIDAYNYTTDINS